MFNWQPVFFVKYFACKFLYMLVIVSKDRIVSFHIRK